MKDLLDRALDTVVSDGASFTARRDNPGKLPGDGWQLTARQGQRGVAGPRGEQGAPGKDTPAIQKWLVNRDEFTITPVYSNGIFGPVLDLRALFEDPA